MQRATILLLAALLTAPASGAQESAEPSDTGTAGGQPAQSEDDRKIHAQTRPESEIEAGFFWVSDDGYPFGDYTGLEDSGFYLLNNVDFEWRTPWQSDDPWHYRLTALNLGLDSRRVTSELEKPGRFGIFFGYDELPVLWNDPVETIFFRSGESDFVLPPGWDPGAAPADMTLFGASLADQSNRFQRRTLGGGFSVVLPENLDFSAGYDRVTKKGRFFEYGTMGLTGGNPRSVALNERFDYSTDLWAAALGYTVQALQLQLQYQGSYFNDHEDSVTWVNPYLANAAWNPNAGFPTTGVPCFDVPVAGCGLGRKAQPPDNLFNQLIASGGYNLGFWNTRITANGAFGWRNQDDDFLPFTVNQALVSTPLPRGDLNGEVNTTLLNFRVDTRPLPRTRLDLRYRFDDRDNDTPRDVYLYIRNDSENQTGGITGSQARVNRPYSFTHHELEADATYTVFERTDWTVGYQWEQWNRTMQEALQVWDHSVFTRLVSHPWPWIHARAEYQHTWQNTSDYYGVQPLYYGHSPESLVGFDPATDFENHPLLRKPYMAEAQKDRISGILTLIPHQDVSVALSTNWLQVDFDEALGLQELETLSSGIDFSWTPMPWLTGSVFYNFERYFARQDSWSFSNLAQSQDPTRRWSGRDKDLGHTTGVNLHVDVLPDRLGVDTQFLFGKTRGLIRVDRGIGLVPPGSDVPYPDNDTKIWDVGIQADYRFWDRFGMRVGYLFERLDTSDWALDGVLPGNLTCNANSCVISAGQESLEGTTHLVSWSIYYNFSW
jgi:MtrB/PioB family decaheme-associated outer membrane protein